MSEKVVREIKIIETEDGFRIEMKGDKEELRQMIFGGREWGFGPFGGRHGHGPFGRHGHGPFGRHGHGPFGRHMPPETFEQPVPPPAPGEGEEDVMYFRGHDPRGRGRGRRFGGRWEARWGYDLGPWWDEGGMTPTDEPPGDV